MSKQKKPRAKAYQPKPVVMPLGMRNVHSFELPGYIASMALGQPHFAEQHVYDLLSNADMTRRIARDDDPILPVAQSMVEAIAEIQHRAARIGKLAVTGDEFQALRRGVGLTMDFLRDQPNIAIARAAQAAVDEFNRLGMLRV